MLQYLYLSFCLQAINVPVFEMGTQTKPVDIAKAGVAEARRIKADVVIVDTAGRLQVRAKLWLGLWARVGAGAVTVPCACMVSHCGQCSFLQRVHLTHLHAPVAAQTALVFPS